MDVRIRQDRVLWALVLAGVLAVPLQGQFYESVGLLPLPQAWPHLKGAAVADMDQNGLPDVVFSDGGAHFYYLPNPGSQGFMGLTPYNVGGLVIPGATGTGPVSLGEADGDGIPDVFLGIPTIAIHVFPGLSGGAPSGQITSALPTSDYSSSFRLADLTGDGRSEVIHSRVLTYGAGIYGGLGVLLNSYPLWVPHFTLTFQYSLAALEVGDLNGDGWQDLVWLPQSPNPYLNGGTSFMTTVRVALGTGPATFAPPTGFSYSPPIPPYGPQYFGLTVDDLDGDGFGDVLVYASNGDPMNPVEGIFGLYGDPQQILQPPVNHMPAVSQNPWLYHSMGAPVAGDIDGDGLKDLIFHEYGFSGPSSTMSVTILRALGPRSFAANFVTEHTLTQAGFRAVPADYDGDGDTDLVLLRGSVLATPSIELLLSRGALGPACPGSQGKPPALWTGDASLGGTYSVALGNVLPLAPTALGVSLAPAMGSTPCSLFIDPAQLVLPSSTGLGVMMSDASGTASLTLALPALPALQGLALFHQWAVLDPAGGLVTLAGNLALTPGRTVVLY